LKRREIWWVRSAVSIKITLELEPFRTLECAFGSTAAGALSFTSDWRARQHRE
jgi:hypothetical protein